MYVSFSFSDILYAISLLFSAMSISSFYGKKVDDISANDSAVDSQEEDGDNLVSIVKRRRLLAAKAAAEKEKKELERRLQ